MKALVVCGDGINCETETAEAFRQAGFEPEIRFLNDLISEKVDQKELESRYRAIAFPGGFSFADDISSGKVLALKIRHGLNWDLHAFAQKGGVVIGICNGFQALLRLGVFGPEVSITHNRQGKFLDTWVAVKAAPNNRSVWLKGIEKFDLPVRHGEGRLVLNPEAEKGAIQALYDEGRVCLRYLRDVNGSLDQIAGLCDSTGRILGLMPHPEAFIRWTAHPEWTTSPERADQEGAGLQLFRNAYEEVKGA